MKILQINKYHYVRAGAERVFFNTMDLLRRKGHDVIPFTTAHPKNLPSEYEQYFVDAYEPREASTLDKLKAVPGYFYSRKAARCLDRLLTDQKPEIAHIHNFFNGLSLSILPVLKKHNVPVCITIHDPRLVCGTANWLNPGRKCKVCRKRLCLPCLTDKCYDGDTLISLMMMMENFQKEFLFNYDKYIDRYIFLNNAYLDGMSDGHPYFRKKADILCNFTPGLDTRRSPRGSYMLYYGRITEEKGLDTLMAAARQIPEIPIHVAGGGPMAERMTRQAPDNITMRGFLSGKELQDEIDGAQMILLPSEWMENNPMTIIEAFSAGKPAIGTRIGGIPELVTDGKSGILVDPYSPDQLACAIRQAWQMPDSRYLEMSEAAVEFAQKNFSEEYHYGRLMEIYKSIMP